MRRATFLIRSVSPTEVPPYFWTIKAMIFWFQLMILRPRTQCLIHLSINWNFHLCCFSDGLNLQTARECTERNPIKLALLSTNQESIRSIKKLIDLLPRDAPAYALALVTKIVIGERHHNVIVLVWMNSQTPSHHPKIIWSDQKEQNA